MKKLTEFHLRQIIREEKLLQELSKGSVLYHRSKEELEPGQRLGGSTHGQGSANERKAEAEEEFEKLRKARHPNKPSRYGAVFLSPTPKSRFNSFGDLYKVKLTGNYHVADSRMFDAYQNPYNFDISQGEAAMCYWNPGSSPNCPDVRDVNPKYLEVVADEAVVVEKIGNDFLTEGDRIRVVESPPVPVQKVVDGTSGDPDVWRDHPKVEEVYKTGENKYKTFDEYDAVLKTPSTWKVIYAKPHDTHRQQSTIQKRGEPGMNYAYSTYKKIHLQDGSVSPSYGAYNDSIEKLKFEEV